MQYSTNFNMNKPELAEQYRLSHWNDNTDIIDTELKRNADAISAETSRATNAETALRNITDSTFKTALLNFCYPVGSIYWSGVATNPHDLFGGTWTQIKDKFIWAKGDNDTLDATGGEKTHTLTVGEIPSHNHSFTPSGSISITTNPTFSGSAVTSGVNSRGHTHSVGAHKHGLNDHRHKFGGMTNSIDGNSRGSFNARLSDALNAPYTVDCSGIVTRSDLFTAYKSGSKEFSKGGVNYYINIDHRHIFSGTTNKASGDTADSTAFDSGGESQNHVHSVTASGTISGGAYKFTGSAGTTGNKGDGRAHNNMPPYIVKYCWQRIA